MAVSPSLKPSCNHKQRRCLSCGAVMLSHPMTIHVLTSPSSSDYKMVVFPLSNDHTIGYTMVITYYCSTPSAHQALHISKLCTHSLLKYSTVTLGKLSLLFTAISSDI